MTRQETVSRPRSGTRPDKDKEKLTSCSCTLALLAMGLLLLSGLLFLMFPSGGLPEGSSSRLSGPPPPGFTWLGTSLEMHLQYLGARSPQTLQSDQAPIRIHLLQGGPVDEERFEVAFGGFLPDAGFFDVDFDERRRGGRPRRERACPV